MRTKIDCDDLLSRHGSHLLAEAIVTHWRNRGYLVHAEGYLLSVAGSWGVRSNLINGLPPKHLALRG